MSDSWRIDLPRFEPDGGGASLVSEGGGLRGVRANDDRGTATASDADGCLVFDTIAIAATTTRF